MLTQPQLTENGNPADPPPSLQDGLRGGKLHQLPAGDTPQGVSGAVKQYKYRLKFSVEEIIQKQVTVNCTDEALYPPME